MSIHLLSPENEIPPELQGKLFRLVGGFLFLISLALSIAPMAQTRSFSGPFNGQHWIGFIAWVISFSALNFFLKKYQIKTNPLLLPVVSLLTGWGLLSIYRLAPFMGLKQSIWLLISTGAFILAIPRASQILKIIRTYKYLWLTAGLILTAITILLGTNPNGFGPRLWLGCCGVYFQPSEMLKLLLILFLAAYFADRQPFNSKLLPLLLPTLLITGLAGLILIFQRDLGTASILFFLYASIIYTALGKKRLPAITFIGFMLAAALGYLFIPVVHLRVNTWINPWADPSGNSYQIIQSLIAIANGGVSGSGPGMGAPYVVPISFSDFIFTSVAEEFGLPGALALILSFLLLVYLAITIGLRASNRHQRFIAVGIAAYFGGQSILIIGGNIRALPLTGVTLPFMSYGGSSLLISFLAVFLLTIIDLSPSISAPPPEQDKPVRHLWITLSLAFGILALITGWWSVYRGPDLLTRTDNPRRAITDQYIQRGKIIDRNATSLSFTIGEWGSFSRSYPYPEAVHVIGYTNPFFGQTGLEASLDPQLRGLLNQSSWDLWSAHLLYGQPPPGLDARLSLDLGLQRTAAELIGTKVGAVVLLRSDTGEILTLLSSPYYDPNQLEHDWEMIIADPLSPLLNRAVQSQYPPGPALAPFLLAETESLGEIPSPPQDLSVTYNGYKLECAVAISPPYTWEAAARAGCPAPLRILGNALGEPSLTGIFTSLDFYKSPNILLNTAPPYIPNGYPIPSATAYGQDEILVSPLQLALAAASISNHGIVPYPQLVLEAQTHTGNWKQISEITDIPQTIFSPSTIDEVANHLAHPQLPIWDTTAFAVTATGQYLTWYIAGSLPSKAQSPPPYTVAVLLEEANAQYAQTIGQQLISEAINP